MKLGTQIRLPDGRVGTVVYNSLIGEGIVWGLHDPDPTDFDETNGNMTTASRLVSDDWPWEPEALLRRPWAGCEQYGFSPEQCVGEEYDVI